MGIHDIRNPAMSSRKTYLLDRQTPLSPSLPTLPPPPPRPASSPLIASSQRPAQHPQSHLVLTATADLHYAPTQPGSYESIGSSTVVADDVHRVPHSKAEVLSGVGEEVHVSLHVPYRDGVEGAVVGEKKFVGGNFGYSRLEVHPPVVEELAVRPVGDTEPRAFVTVDVQRHGRRHRPEEDLSRGRVRSWRLAAGELQHGPDSFVERGREVKVDVGLHLRQTGDSGIGNGGGTVEDASDVLGPSV
ncbi:hypothetical protein SprV_0100122200 [Sparganum proliferum]